ncbi:MAG TPA: polysaccharide deacetylase family protein [Bacteroidota bacterium]|nr:polysaccharide deacetylase family protein [Bacteroidota bacterium]
MSFFNSVIAPRLFPSILWHTGSRSVHLTFDDGPHPEATVRALEVLQRRKVQATFFFLGSNVQKYPEIASEVRHAGHDIGNHSLSHTSLFLKPSAVQRAQIGGGARAIEEAVGVRPILFRPPFGYFDHQTHRAAKAEGQTMVMWSIDPHDYLSTDSHRITDAVSRQIRAGSIVLLHDNDLTSPVIARSLDEILQRLIDRGFTFSRLSL